MVGGHSGCLRVYDPLKQCVATAGVNDSHVRDSVFVILPVEDGNTLLGTTSTLAFHDTIISTECPAIFAVHKATHFAMYDANLVPHETFILAGAKQAQGGEVGISPVVKPAGGGHRGEDR